MDPVLIEEILNAHIIDKHMHPVNIVRDPAFSYSSRTKKTMISLANTL